MTEDMTPIFQENVMNFNCDCENECFNECCRDLNQALTPYDALRLKNNLGISSQEFLKTYTSLHYGPDSGLPIIEFKPNPDKGYECPFVKPEGCSVYEDRPCSCRMYPLARAITRSRQTGEVNQYFALIEEPHCKGFGKGKGLSVEQWLKGQNVDKHNKENDKLMELISLKNKMIPGKLEGEHFDIFYLALYDLDEFRAQIFENDLLAEFIVPDTLLKIVRKDDEALLNLGIAWVKYKLFGGKIMVGE